MRAARTRRAATPPLLNNSCRHCSKGQPGPRVDGGAPGRAAGGALLPRRVSDHSVRGAPWCGICAGPCRSTGKPSSRSWRHTLAAPFRASSSTRRHRRYQGHGTMRICQRPAADDVRPKDVRWHWHDRAHHSHCALVSLSAQTDTAQPSRNDPPPPAANQSSKRSRSPGD